MNPADVVLALDASGSIGKDNFVRSLQFAQDMVLGLPIEAGARVGAFPRFFACCWQEFKD